MKIELPSEFMYT